MRIPPRSRFAPLAPLALALAALAPAARAEAQGVDCGGFDGGAAPPREPDVAEPIFNQIFVVSPPPGLLVPRNVEIRLGGDRNALDVEPAQMAVQLLDAGGARVPVERTGMTLRPLAPLPPGAPFVVRIEPTEANPCPECFSPQEVPFTTTDEIDREAPALDGAPPVHVFVLPNGQEAEQCGFFNGQTHIIAVDFGPGLPLNTWVAVAAKKGLDGGPRALFESFNTGSAFPAQGNVGTSVPTALGDAFFVAITPRDLAGNVGDARVVRVRARSFTDQNVPRDELSPLWCDMPDEPLVVAPAAMPENGELTITFPFEEIPVGLARGDDVTPLVPVSDIAGGRVYRTAESLDPGAYDVVALPCTSCVCDGCTRMTPVTVEVAAGRDTTPPAAPVLVELREDASPERAVAEQCRADAPAIIAVLEPGDDDTTGALELRYDVNIALDGQPPVVLGRGLVPVDEDGRVAVRIETAPFGRVFGEPFELTLEAIDGAGNRTSATTTHGPEDASGCTSSGRGSAPSAALALLALLALVPARRRG